MADDTPTSNSDPPLTWLMAELARWRADGIVSEEQSLAILARYGLAEAPAEDRTGPGRLITAISAIGAILLGIGAILFFAANWAAMPSFAKVALICTAIGLAYGTGYALRYHPGHYPKVGESLVLLGALFFGAGVFLIQQIFHMNAGDPVGVLLWTVGVLPLAYALAHRGLLGLGLLTLLLWFGWKMVAGADDGSPIDFVVAYLAVGLTYMALGYHHYRVVVYRRFEGLYRGLGLLVSFVALHVMTYRVFWEAVSEWDSYGAERSAADVPGFVLGLMAVALIAAATVPWRQARDRPTLVFEALGLVGVAVLAGLAMVFTGGSAVHAIAFNLVYFSAVIGVIAIGYLNAEPYAVNIGLTFFALGVIARYFDMFWDLMPRSVFFMMGGLVLLVGSLALERSRRRLLSDMPAARGGGT